MKIASWTGNIHTYIHTYFIGSSPRGFSESILHYKIINQVHDNKNITMIKEDKGHGPWEATWKGGSVKACFSLTCPFWKSGNPSSSLWLFGFFQWFHGTLPSFQHRFLSCPLFFKCRGECEVGIFLYPNSNIKAEGKALYMSEEEDVSPLNRTN